MEMSEYNKFDADDIGCIPSLDRMNSCLGPANTTSLVWALEKGDVQTFAEQLMELDSTQINEELIDRQHSTILHLVVESGRIDFMHELMRRRDINPNHLHTNLKKFPIHVAAEQGDNDMISILLDCGADVNARTESGDTPLHVLAKRSAVKWIKDESKKHNIPKIQKQFVAAVQRVLSVPGVNIDSENKIGFTAIYFAVKNGSEEVVKLLLNAGACITTENDDGDTVEDLIEQKMPQLFASENLDLSKNRINKDTIENKLFHLLYSEYYDPGKFQESWEDAEKNNNRVPVDADNGTYTFLQFCCDQGHDKLVKFLLEKGADPNLYCNTYQIPPLVLAAHHGYYKILQIFKEWTTTREKGSVDFCATHMPSKKENAIHKILKQESKAHINVQYRDYDRCLSIMLDEKLVFHKMVLPAINAQDQFGNSPLHVAAQTNNTSAIRKLLRSEANIGLKNFRQELPIAHIPPLVMMEFLDDCLQSNGLPSDEEFQITFKYSFLGPPLQEALQKSSEASPLTNDDVPQQETPHCFNDLPEAEPLWYMAQLPDHRQLLTHPVITSFLCLKWRRIRPYFYINLFFYMLFVGCLTAYLVRLNIDLQAVKSGKHETLTELKDKFFCVILLMILTVREVLQALVSVRRYIFGNGYINLENAMEVTMIGISWYLVCGGDALLEKLWVTQSLSATAILLSWCEMVLLWGRHPKLSTFVEMLTRVSLNFLLFLTWAASIIIAFGFAFFVILCRQPAMDPSAELKNEYFNTTKQALLKTIVMSLTGEIEFEGIDFDSNEYFQIIFVLWIFFVMLVLINLLNGLAVSDIASIQKEAEILSYVSRIETVAFIESMLLGDPFAFLTNWPPFSWSHLLPKCNCLHSLHRRRFIRRMFNFLIGNTLLFTDRLMNKRAVFYPNQSRKEGGKERSLPGPTADGNGRQTTKDKLLMDGDILENAKMLVVKKQERDQLEEIKAKLRQMEKGLLLISRQQNHIIEKLNG